MGLHKDWSINSTRMEIIKPILCYGAIPYKCMEYFDATSTEMVRRVVRKMSRGREDIVDLSANASGKKYIKLIDRLSNKEIISKFPEEYVALYHTDEVRALRNKATQKWYCERVMSIADAGVFSHCAGEKAYPPERGGFNENKKNGTLRGCYYTSAEFRRSTNAYHDAVIVDEIGNRTIMGSRMSGVYIAPSGSYYMMYSIGSTHITWDFNEEKMYRELSMSLKDADNGGLHYEGMVFLYERDRAAKNVADITTNRRMIRKEGVKLLTKILKYTPKNRNLKQNLSMNNWIYGCAYFLPQSRDGVELMKIMSEPGWKEDMQQFFLAPEILHGKDGTCDGKLSNDDGTYTFVDIFCIPDLAQFYRFYMRYLGQKLDKEREKITDKKDQYVIRCFDFQENFVKSVMEDENVAVISTPFSEFLEKYKKRAI